MPLAGGIYYYTERSLGPLAGTISGLLNWSAIALKSSFAIFGMAELLYQLWSVPRIPSGIAMTIFFLLVNLIGTNAAAWAQDIMVFILLAAMGAFIVCGAPAVDPARFTPFFLDGKANSSSSHSADCSTWRAFQRRSRIPSATFPRECSAASSRSH